MFFFLCVIYYLLPPSETMLSINIYHQGTFDPESESGVWRKSRLHLAKGSRKHEKKLEAALGSPYTRYTPFVVDHA